MYSHDIQIKHMSSISYNFNFILYLIEKIVCLSSKECVGYLVSKPNFIIHLNKRKIECTNWCYYHPPNDDGQHKKKFFLITQLKDLQWHRPTLAIVCVSVCINSDCLTYGVENSFVLIQFSSHNSSFVQFIEITQIQ